MSHLEWVKYRHAFSASFGEWEWLMFPNGATDQTIANWVGELVGEYSWSEHYRGIHWERAIPPREVVLKEIQLAGQNADSYQRRKLRLTEYLNELDANSGSILDPT